ncbi:MAG: sulfotransferase domain-containing protein [Solirubrobacterales bacterium]|nr:sulfotransferase domain-containing protein [Solirubrobacterales bacterium]
MSASRAGRRTRWLGDLDIQARRRLPKPLYRTLVGGYHDLLTLSGRGPGRGRLLPDFVIAGAAKAGTTSLFGWLSEHPFIEPASKKEVHYFDYNHFRGEDWYRKHFPLSSERERFAREHGRPFITGEASPSYLSHHWVPERLARLKPDVKLLIALRNPIDRAYSQFQMSHREHEEPLDSFSDAIAAEEERLVPERARMLADESYNSWPIGCWSYLMRGRYAEQLEHWMSFFGGDQFHFITLEQLASAPQQALDGVHDFLEIPRHDYAELPHLHSAQYSSIDPAARAQLASYFRPHNERLYELVGSDFGWEH